MRYGSKIQSYVHFFIENPQKLIYLVKEKQSKKPGPKTVQSVLILKVATTIVGLVFFDIQRFCFVNFFDSKILRPKLISYLVCVPTGISSQEK